MKPLSGVITIIAVIVVMLGLSWQRWCEPLIDFGRELYVPWQLSLGKSLYSDVAYFNGPLSPHFNSILFRIFGDSLLTLAFANVLLLTVMLIILRSILAKLADANLATIACACLVPLMCIAQPGPMGNYNFITPYSHEMTHGLLLSLLAIWSLMRGRPMWDLLAGVCAGLTILAKPEIAIACCGAVLAGASLVRSPLGVARLIGAMAIPPILAWILFRGDAFIAFAHLFDSRLTTLPFYRLTMGTFEPGRSITAIAIWSVAAMVVLLISESIAQRLDRSRGLILLAGLVVLGILSREMVNWRNAALPLIFVNAWALVHTYREKQPDRFTFTLFATLLLAKIVLNVTLSNYGFALALPAVCVAVCFFGSWKPGLRLNEGHGLRFATIAMLVLATGVHLAFSITQWRSKTVVIGSGADALRVSPDRSAALDLLEVMRSLPDNATVAVVPQGVMLNYLSRRENSTGFIVILPPEVLMFGEAKMSAAFTQRPPEYVVVARSDLTEYGYRSFTGYAPELAAKIDAFYAEQAAGEGWTLLRRRDFTRPRN